MYRVVKSGYGGYRRLQGGSNDFSWHTRRKTLYHNIYIHPTILIIIIIIIMFPNTILILILIIIVSNQSSSLAGLNVTICLHPRPPTASSTTTNHSRFFSSPRSKYDFEILKKLDPEFFCLWVFLGLRTFSAPRLFLILVCVRKLSPGRLFVPPPYKPLGLPNKKLMLEDIILYTFLGNILALYFVFWDTQLLRWTCKVHTRHLSILGHYHYLAL